MHLLQVCNVGHICGGTAACAWSITRALTSWRHSVLCLSPPTTETVRAFAPVHVEHSASVTRADVQRLKPDLVLLHNTAAGRVETPFAAFTIQYLHSRITPVPADVTVACSQWLRSQYVPEMVDGVLYQPVHVPIDDTSPTDKAPDKPITVGRLCTPNRHKWPHDLIPRYADWAERHPQVSWEFVGCPGEMVDRLSAACRGRATFWPAEWLARRHLWRWDALLYHHPTLTETFGRTVAEALQAGCVPIVDDRGGFREQLDQGGGYLCRGIDDFHAALRELLRTPRRGALSQHARSVGHARFSGPAFAARFRRLLSAAVDVPASRGRQ